MGKYWKLTPRQQMFIDLLPDHNFNIAQAGLAAGYSKTFADTRLAVRCKVPESPLKEAFNNALEKHKKRFKVDLDKLADNMLEVYNLSIDVGDRTNAKGALDSLIRMQGGFIDRSHNLNENVEHKPPSNIHERRQWLQGQLDLIDRQLNAGTAIAGDHMLSYNAAGTNDNE